MLSSIRDLTVTNELFFFVTSSGASKTDICDNQILNRRQQLFKYIAVISILMQDNDTSIWA